MDELLQAPGAGINKVLADITSALVGHLDIPSLLQQVVSTSMRVVHAEVCSIFLEEKPGILTMMAGSGFAAPLVGKAEYRVGEALTGTIAQTGRGINIKSLQEMQEFRVDGRQVWRGKFDQLQWGGGQNQFRNCIALPLRIKNTVVGVIKAENKRLEVGPFFTEQDETYLGIIANVVALAIENARLYEQTERQLKTIASKAAHRINNLLTDYDSIELDLKDQTGNALPDKKTLADIVTRVSETTRTLKRMVTELRTFGKPLDLSKKLCDLNVIVADEVGLARPPASVSICKDLDLQLPALYLDAGRISEAIKELLRNSIKAMGMKGGSITVSTRYSGPDSAEVILEVSDTGSGFPPDFPVFEPFHSTDPQSTGLGLATVKELVEAHGGRIAASNNPSGGALVTISLPSVQGDES